MPRPPMPDGKNKTISLRVNNAELEFYRKAAQDTGETLSNFFRLAAMEYLANQGYFDKQE